MFFMLSGEKIVTALMTKILRKLLSAPRSVSRSFPFEFGSNDFPLCFECRVSALAELATHHLRRHVPSQVLGRRGILRNLAIRKV
jgi:hypothetical protein